MTQLFTNSPPRDICLVRVSAIGDTCHALAVVRRLQDNWPAARISWIIGQTEAGLMAGLDGVDLILFDKSTGRSARKSVQRQLAGKRFDVVLCMHASMRVNPLYRHIAAPVRLGFDYQRARDFQCLFTNRRISRATGQHALEAMLEFASEIGAQETPLRWDLPLTAADVEFAAEYKVADRRTMVISPCSSERSRNFRNWPSSEYAAVAKYAQRRYNAHVVLTGGNSEIERRYASELIAQLPDAVNLIGKTNLKQLAAVLAQADIVLCPDSGPAHIATATGTPVIGLYAGSNPRRTGPYLSQALTVDRYPDAVARYLHTTPDQLRWGQRVRDPEVMSLITIKDVIEKIDVFLSTS